MWLKVLVLVLWTWLIFIWALAQCLFETNKNVKINQTIRFLLFGNLKTRLLICYYLCAQLAVFNFCHLQQIKSFIYSASSGKSSLPLDIDQSESYKRPADCCWQQRKVLEGKTMAGGSQFIWIPLLFTCVLCTSDPRAGRGKQYRPFYCQLIGVELNKYL